MCREENRNGSRHHVTRPDDSGQRRSRRRPRRQRRGLAQGQNSHQLPSRRQRRKGPGLLREYADDAGKPVYAAVFPTLAPGNYTVIKPGCTSGVARTVTVSSSSRRGSPPRRNPMRCTPFHRFLWASPRGDSPFCSERRAHSWRKTPTPLPCAKRPRLPC